MRRACRLWILGWVAALAWTPGAPAQQVADASRFQHGLHAGFACAECHSTGSATTVSNTSWCADCHHVATGLGQCQRCHTAAEIAPEPLRRLVTFQLPEGAESVRSLTFDHGTHADLSCGTCHADDAALKPAGQCSSCHSDHHGPVRDCTACHSEPPVGVHPETVHVNLDGCGSSGCHVAEGVDYGSMARGDRNFCVSCHVAQSTHEQPEPCRRCHLLGQVEGREP